ncbi:hypothetical protein KIH74_35395 [Kineosporia sp. J2-2]|uniref:Uncharacterized protein n=1 Tax=Kineosporia corallincola TaxID=2835133 RepID=A0ABS5TU05_9ACTN|nr:hypothetical protein [Kineosporia corallincola]MBT0774283.1 hypothetical protein [Kineosporia corallincola]
MDDDTTPPVDRSFQETPMREIIHPDGHLWQRTSVADGDAVDHERIIATVRLASNDEIVVRVAQREDVDILADPAVRHLHPPRITLGGTFELTSSESAEVIAALGAAKDFSLNLENHLWSPRLVGET